MPYINYTPPSYCKGCRFYIFMSEEYGYGCVFLGAGCTNGSRKENK